METVKLELQKQVAVAIMQELRISNRQIDDFVLNGKARICVGGGWREIEEDGNVWNKIQELQKERGLLIYAVTFEQFSFGWCYSFLIVSKYEEDWEHEIRSLGDGNYVVQAYVWNISRPECSEPGGVVICAQDGLISRIG